MARSQGIRRENFASISAEAAKNGAQLVSFAEAFIPSYPVWAWSRPLDPILSTHYIKNSLVVDSPEMRTIRGFAAEHGVVALLGFSGTTTIHFTLHNPSSIQMERS
jgi:predicted amidohydrolase